VPSLEINPVGAFRSGKKSYNIKSEINEIRFTAIAYDGFGEVCAKCSWTSIIELYFDIKGVNN